jgi:hypothetical protein
LGDGWDEDGLDYKEEVNEATVEYVEGCFGSPKTEGFLPNVMPGKE